MSEYAFYERQCQLTPTVLLSPSSHSEFSANVSSVIQVLLHVSSAPKDEYYYLNP